MDEGSDFLVVLHFPNILEEKLTLKLNHSEFKFKFESVFG